MSGGRGGGGRGGGQTIIGGGAPDYGPVTGLTASVTAPGWTVSFTPKTAPGARYLVEHCPGTDLAEQPTNPFRWKRLTFVPSSQSSYRYKHAWELESYTIRVTTVAPDGTKSAPVTTTVSMPQWVPQNHLSLWSEDLTQGGQGSGVWSRDTGVAAPTVAGGGGYLINLGAASRGIGQAVPVNPVGGRTYTLRVTLRAAVAGDVGKTIQVNLHSPDDSSYNDKLITLAAADTVSTHEVTFGAGLIGRTASIGINSYGSSTATQVIVTRIQLHAGPASGLPAYEVTQGPGSTWQEPIVFTDTNTPAGGLTWAGWHRNTADAVTPAVWIKTGRALTLTGRLRGRSDLIYSEWGSALVDMLGMLGRGDHPGVAGRARGYACRQNAGARFRMRQCYWLQTCGSYSQNFQGYGAAQNYECGENIWDEIDGRISAGASGYVPSGWGNIGPTPPPGAQIGWQGNNMARINTLNPQNSNPYALLNSRIGRNLLLSRPGFSSWQDTIAVSNVRGPSWDDPVRVYDNCLDTQGQVYDFNAMATFAAGGQPSSFSFGYLPSNFNLQITVGTGGAAIGATSIPLTRGLGLQSNIPSGTVLTFASGKTATLSAAYAAGSPGATTLTVQALAAALTAGDVSSSLVRNDSPYAFSGSSIMPQDSSLHDFANLNRNAAYVEIAGNRAIGGAGAFALFDGQNIRYTGNNRMIGARTMRDGVTAFAGGSRLAGPQVNQFIGDGYRGSNSIQGMYVKTGYQKAYLDSVLAQNAAVTPTPASNERYDIYYSPTPATVDDEWQEIANWQAEMAAANVQIGPFA